MAQPHTHRAVRRPLSGLTRTIAAAIAGAITLGLAATPALAAKHARAPTAPGAPQAGAFDSFNEARDTPLLKNGDHGPAVVRAQILLDRAWFSIGEIDGRFAANMQRIVKAFQVARGLASTGTVTPQTWHSLREDGGALLTRYTITEQDAAGPFTKIPVRNEDRRQLKGMPYETLEEALAERFHTSTAYLKQLNGRARIEAGSDIAVPNVLGGKPQGNAASIEIDKSERVLYVLDTGKRPLAAFPISIGNEKSDPLPVGVMTIRSEVKNPSFTYDPVLLKHEPVGATKMELPPGPNNPIGNMWLGLSKPHWGIHGTAVPSNVGHSETNGCIHLTNWDAERVSILAKVGFKVDVRR